MTTLYGEKATCSLCGTENVFKAISSTNAVGWPDLDTRPPEMQRSTIFAWVQRCPQCGYCASDISIPRSGAQAVVNTREYRNQLNDPAYPELANSFLCKAIVDRESENFTAATWALIYAAWACDDSQNHEQAKACRQKAAKMLSIAEEHEQYVAEQDGADTGILVDLLRRSGQTERAKEIIEARQDHINEDIVLRILDFQKVLLDKKDLSSHTIGEALGEEDGAE